jgi:hypothetical protein
MTVQITIRLVPDDVRDQLALRAAEQHQSMQEFLLGELKRIASRPSINSWLETVQRRKGEAGTSVSTSAILEAREADRK